MERWWWLIWLGGGWGCGEPPLEKAAEGSCVDGVDEDGDGLVDCEDADCLEAAGCVEADCGDGVDGDADGLLDCEDEDCWGTEGCLESAALPSGTVVSSRVLGGWAMLGRHRRSTSARYDYIYNRARSSWVQAGSIWGTARVRQPDVTDSTACTWWLSAMSWRKESAVFASSGGARELTAEALERGGVVVDSGCPLRSHGFLPRDFTVDASAMLGSGLPWYRGQATWSAFDHTPLDSTYRQGSELRSSWWIPELDAGETFEAVLP
jgi:hypothetical protein